MTVCGNEKGEVVPEKKEETILRYFLDIKKPPSVLEGLFGAENGARTRDLNLGKVALYQLSYFRVVPFRDDKGTKFFLFSKFFP